MRNFTFRTLIFTIAAILGLSASLKAQDLILTGIVDGDLPGGLPKAVELYVVNDIADLSMYSVARYTNGSADVSGQFDFPAVAATAGDFISIAGTLTGFNTFFGSDADYESGVISGNGNDGYAVLMNGTVIDRFGESGVDGTSTAWEYTDGYAYRVSGSSANADFAIDDWMVYLKGLDGFATNAEATVPFPAKTYSTTPVVDETAPEWATDYPMAMNIMATSFDIAAQLNETSTVYYVVVNGGDTAPTVAEVIAGTATGGAAAVAAGSFSAGLAETMETVSSLTEGETYDVYLVAEDDEDTPNVQESTVSFSVVPVAPPDVLYSESFDSDLGSFTAISVEGDQVWGQGVYQGTTYARMSGFSGGAQLNEDWLISGAIDLDASTENMLSFLSAVNFDGPALQLLVSTDFNGTYDLTNVSAATWTDITDQAAWSAGNYVFTESGMIDLSSYSGTVYFAFVYTSNDVDGAATWEITDFMVTGYLIPESDASLSDLQVDGTTLSSFDVAKTNYTVELPAGTSTVPTVSATTTDPNASAEITDATDLTGDEAARTTTIVVTAQDGETTQTYTILFNPVIEVASLSEFRLGDESRTYLVTSEMLVTQTNSYRNKKYIQDQTAGVEIDDPDGVITTAYAIGDIITNIKAKITIYNDMVQMNPVEDPGAPVSSGNDVVAEVLTIEDFNSSLATIEGKYVKLEAVTFEDAGATFENGNNYNLSDGTNSAVLRTSFFDVDYTGTEIPAMADVSGVVISFRGTAQIVPRFAADINAYSSDATLSNLQVNGTSVTGFDPETSDYAVELEVGTTAIPDVTYSTSNENAEVTVTDATDLFGSEAERTTTVEVVSQDGTSTVTYTIVFTVDNTSTSLDKAEMLQLYPVPATDFLVVKGLETGVSFDIIDITGSVVRSVEMNQPEMRLNISDLDAGVYFIRTGSEFAKFVKK